jgi:hypothetical protein
MQKDSEYPTELIFPRKINESMIPAETFHVEKIGVKEILNGKYHSHSIVLYL